MKRIKRFNLIIAVMIICLSVVMLFGCKEQDKPADATSFGGYQKIDTASFFN